MQEYSVEILKSINELEVYFSSQSDLEISKKASPEKWSKKEILGHLVDSAIYNLIRFMEVQFKPLPFQIDTYDQDSLVKANKYQGSDSGKLLELWKAMNSRVIEIINNIDHSTAKHQILLPSGELSHVKFLVDDYVVHLKHHVKQIIEP